MNSPRWTEIDATKMAKNALNNARNTFIVRRGTYTSQVIQKKAKADATNAAMKRLEEYENVEILCTANSNRVYWKKPNQHDWALSDRME